jgi:hypothetical protein
VVLEQGGGHLRAAGVVHADEQDFHRVLVHRKPPQVSTAVDVLEPRMTLA